MGKKKGNKVKKFIIKTINITKEHQKWIDSNFINLSKFVRNKIDEEIGDGAKN